MKKSELMAAGYRVTKSDGPLGPMYHAYAPDGTGLGACGGGNPLNVSSRAWAKCAEHAAKIAASAPREGGSGS